MPVGDAKALILKGSEALEEAEALLVAAREIVASASAIAVRVTYGSRHDDVTTALALLREANHEFELVLRRLVSSIDHANAYLGVIG